MKIALCIILAIFLFHVGSNISRLISTNHYFKKFKRRDKDLMECVSAVEKLFNRAGTNTDVVSTRYCGHKISYCAGLNLEPGHLRSAVENAFYRTIGVYKGKIWQSFSPLYWLEFPLRMVPKLKVSLSSPWQKFVSFLMWIVGAIGTFVIQRIFDAYFPNFSETCLLWIERIIK